MTNDELKDYVDEKIEELSNMLEGAATRINRVTEHLSTRLDAVIRDIGVSENRQHNRAPNN